MEAPSSSYPTDQQQYSQEVETIPSYHANQHEGYDETQQYSQGAEQGYYERYPTDDSYNHNNQNYEYADQQQYDNNNYVNTGAHEAGTNGGLEGASDGYGSYNYDESHGYEHQHENYQQPEPQFYNDYEPQQNNPRIEKFDDEGGAPFGEPFVLVEKTEALSSVATSMTTEFEEIAAPPQQPGTSYDVSQRAAATDQRNIFGRHLRALSFGFGGRIVRSIGNEIVIAPLSEEVTTSSAAHIIDPESISSFAPLLTKKKQTEDFSEEELKDIAADIVARGTAPRKGAENSVFIPQAIEDGMLAGSTSLLWETIGKFILSRGRRAERLSSTGPVPTTFDGRLLRLLTVSQAQNHHEDFSHGEFDSSRKADIHAVSTVLSSVHQTHPNPSALKELETLMLNGDQDQAITHAVKNELWAQALIVAHFVSAAAYRRVVSEFTLRNLAPGTPISTVFHVLAGRGVEFVQNPDMFTAEELQSSWKQSLRAILANRPPHDSSVLQAFGDRLWLETGSVSAAHICYIAAGHNALETQDRIMLVGGDHVSPDATRTSFVTPGAIMRTEAFLFGQSLNSSKVSTVQYMESIREFQPFRLVFAMWLADIGFIEEARSWTESIKECYSQFDQSLLDPVILDQLEMFDARLCGRTQLFTTSSTYGNTFSVNNGNTTAKKKNFFVERLEESLLVSPDTPAPVAVAGHPQMHLPTTTVPQTRSYSPPPQFDFTSVSPAAAAKSPVLADATTKEAADEGMISHDPFGAAKAKWPAPPTRKLELTAPPTPISPKATSPTARQPLKQENAPAAPSVGPTIPGPTGPPPTAPQPTLARPAAPVTSVAPSGTQQSASANSGEGTASSGGGWGFGDLRGWLVQKVLGVPKNATVAKTGDRLTAYYDEKQKKWIFPGDPQDSGPSMPAGPPIMAQTTTSAGSAPVTNAQGERPSNQPPAPRPGGGGLKNRYVVAS